MRFQVYSGLKGRLSGTWRSRLSQARGELNDPWREVVKDFLNATGMFPVIAKQNQIYKQVFGTDHTVYFHTAKMSDGLPYTVEVHLEPDTGYSEVYVLRADSLDVLDQFVIDDFEDFVPAEVDRVVTTVNKSVEKGAPRRTTRRVSAFRRRFASGRRLSASRRRPVSARIRPLRQSNAIGYPEDGSLADLESIVYTYPSDEEAFYAAFEVFLDGIDWAYGNDFEDAGVDVVEYLDAALTPSMDGFTVADVVRKAWQLAADSYDVIVGDDIASSSRTCSAGLSHCTSRYHRSVYR